MTTLNGTQVKKWSLHWPKFGSARADLILAEGEAPTGKVTIVCGTLELRGEVLRSWLDAADRPHAVVVMGLGWQKLVERPLSFQSDGGIRLRSILEKLAAHAGETIEQPTDSTIGNWYELIASRPGEPMRWADALNDLTRHGYCPEWRVDPDGVTRFGARTQQSVDVRATLMSRHGGTGYETYGIDDPAQFLPGNTIEGVTIERLDLRETDGKLEVDVYSSTAAPQLRDLVRQILATELGSRCRTYVVSACHADGRCDLAPPTDVQHLPELRNVEQWITGGATFVATKGDEAIVEIRDMKGTRPVITGFRRRSGEPTLFPGGARVGDYTVSGGIGQTISFADAAGTPLCLCYPATPPIPAPFPYLVSFGVVPPTVLPIPSATPLYGAVGSGSEIFGVKRS